ncbi:MAG: hypothetical protein ABI876_10160 [Bacteroidota bacterium]
MPEAYGIRETIQAIQLHAWEKSSHHPPDILTSKPAQRPARAYMMKANAADDVLQQSVSDKAEIKMGKPALQSTKAGDFP